MVYVLSCRASVKNGLSAYYYDALCSEVGGKFFTYLAGNAVGIFKYVYFYKLARLKAVGKTFEHIFTYAFFADLTYGRKICRERF